MSGQNIQERPLLPLKILESTSCNGKCICLQRVNSKCQKIEGNVEGNVDQL